MARKKTRDYFEQRRVDQQNDYDAANSFLLMHEKKRLCVIPLTIAHNDATIMLQRFGGDCMPKIIPIRDLRDTGKMSELCSESREPIFITKNGYGDMVIMSMAVYEESLARLEMRDKILAGKAQADAGDLIDGPAAMEELGKKHGISL